MDKWCEKCGELHDSGSFCSKCKRCFYQGIDAGYVKNVPDSKDTYGGTYVFCPCGETTYWD